MASDGETFSIAWRQDYREKIDIQRSTQNGHIYLCIQQFVCWLSMSMLGAGMHVDTVMNKFGSYIIWILQIGILH